MTRHRVVRAIFVVTFLAEACRGLTTELEPDQDEIPLPEIIHVSSVSAGSIPADGKSTTVLSARIPLKSNTKTVKFATTAGTFVETGTKEVAVGTVPDGVERDRRVATTVIRSDTLAATAIVRAMVGEYYDTVSVRFVKP